MGQMQSRLQLQNELEVLLDIKEVHYQPGPSVELSYPCVVYNRSNSNTAWANGYIYRKKSRYSLTVIDPDPDSPIPDILLDHFQYIRMERSYSADYLNHWIFELYY